MPTRELTTERKVLDPIIGSRIGVYNALENLKRQHTDLVPIEYPHEVARGQWRTVVSIPVTRPRNVTVRPSVRHVTARRMRRTRIRDIRLSFSLDKKAAAYVAGGTMALAAVGATVYVVVSAVVWAVEVIMSIVGLAMSHWEMIAVVTAILTILGGGGVAKACTHADHHR